MKCNHDCFNCIYDECINDDEPVFDELRTSAQIDAVAKHSQHEHKTIVSMAGAEHLTGIERTREYQRRYRLAHKKELDFYKKQWYQKHINRERKKHREYNRRRAANEQCKYRES